MVVADGRAARSGQHRHGSRRTSPREVGVDARPQRVERRQPVEEDRVLRVPAGQPLVQVVVGVDEARGDQASRRIDDLGAGAHVVRRAARTDRRDDAVVDDDMPRLVLGARGVDIAT